MNTLCLSLLLGFFASLEASRLTERSTHECKEEGRFPDPSDCGYYFECVPDGEGSLTAYRRFCHGDGFNPRTLSCTNPSKIKGCKTRRSRHYFPTSQYNALCTNPKVKFACADCGTVIMCDDGRAYPTKCEDHSRCVTEQSNFDGAVCYPKYNKSCQCQEGNTFYQDPYSNGTFFLCKEKNGVPLFYTCPPDTYFNINTSTCLSPDGLPGCTEDGVFAHPMDCKMFYTCVLTLEGWVQTRMTCPKSKLFNKYTEVCENPCEWSPSEFKCTEQGRFKNPQNCKQFFECIPGDNGELSKIMRTCPANYDWNDETKICIKSVNSDCKPDTELPIELCQNDYNAICGNTSTTQRPQTTAITSTTGIIDTTTHNTVLDDETGASPSAATALTPTSPK